MSLIDSLKADLQLQHHFIAECEENGLCVVLDGKIQKDDYLIIKVDGFYNDCLDYKDPDTRLMNAPASIDCLIIIRCREEPNTYRVLLVELKNTPYKPDMANMEEKFRTTLHDFMANRFRSHFYNASYHLHINLFIQIATAKRGIPVRSVTADYLLKLPMMTFAGKKCSFNFLPPVISPC
jgi:hypothetical protein